MVKCVAVCVWQPSFLDENKNYKNKASQRQDDSLSHQVPMTFQAGKVLIGAGAGKPQCNAQLLREPIEAH